jgi:hypothetical protein
MGTPNPHTLHIPPGGHVAAADAVAAGLVGDVLKVALLMRGGQYTTAEITIGELVDVRAALMCAAALIPVTGLNLDECARRALPAATALMAGHGTASGYERHRNRGEEPCPACRAGRREHDRRQYQRRQGKARVAAEQVPA